MPRALAVLTLMVSENFVGCCTGRSAGLAPLRRRSTYPRDECLSLEWFRSRAEAKVIIERWRRRHYNEVRPHSSVGYLTPDTPDQRSLKRRAGALR